MAHNGQLTTETDQYQRIAVVNSSMLTQPQWNTNYKVIRSASRHCTQCSAFVLIHASEVTLLSWPATIHSSPVNPYTVYGWLDSPWYNSSQAEFYLTYDGPYVRICVWLLSVVVRLMLSVIICWIGIYISNREVLWYQNLISSLQAV